MRQGRAAQTGFSPRCGECVPDGERRERLPRHRELPAAPPIRSGILSGCNAQPFHRFVFVFSLIDYRPDTPSRFERDVNKLIAGNTPWGNSSLSAFSTQPFPDEAAHPVLKKGTHRALGIGETVQCISRLPCGGSFSPGCHHRIPFRSPETNEQTPQMQTFKEE